MGNNSTGWSLLPPDFQCKNDQLEFLISHKAPRAVAEPVYGWILPIVVFVTLITNVFVVIVLSRKHLRTPTNTILLVMAVMESLTGLVALPWMTYIYTFKGFETEDKEGLPEFWCHNAAMFMENLPSIFHTSGVWLTVFLAVQRYIYVCLPNGPSIGTMHRTKVTIVSLCAAAFVFELPKCFFSDFRSSEISFNTSESRPSRLTKRVCFQKVRCWVQKLGQNQVYSTYLTLKALFVNFLPCMTLVVFTGILLKFLYDADTRRQRTLMNRSEHRPMSENRRKRSPTDEIGNRLPVPSISRSSSQITVKRRYSARKNAAVYFQNTTKMLTVIIIFFIGTHLPYATILLLHVILTITGKNRHWGAEDFDKMNVALIMTNALSLIQYPFNFAIYCSMSKQFRITVRQLFTSRRLFYEQPLTTAQGHHGSRTNLHVVNIAEQYGPNTEDKMAVRYSVVLLEASQPTHLGRRLLGLRKYILGSRPKSRSEPGTSFPAAGNLTLPRKSTAV